MRPVPRRLLAAGIAVLLAGCPSLQGLSFGSRADAGDDAPSMEPGDSGTPDTWGADTWSPDAGTQETGEPDAARCDPTAPFQAPIRIASLSTGVVNAQARLSPDELTVYFQRQDTASDPKTYRLYVASRATTADPFGAGVAIQELNIQGVVNQDPSPTSNGLTLYFASNRAADGGAGITFSLFAAQRPNNTGPFGPAAQVLLMQPPTSLFYGSYVLPDGTELYFDDSGNNGNAYVAPVVSGEVGPQVLVPGFAPQPYYGATVLTPDQLTFYYSSTQATIAVATRSDKSLPFSGYKDVDELNGPSVSYNTPSWISDDGCHLYFHSIRGASPYIDIYYAERQ